MPLFSFHSSGGKQGIDDGFFRCFDGSHEQGCNIFIMQYRNGLYWSGGCVRYAYRVSTDFPLRRSAAYCCGASFTHSWCQPGWSPARQPPKRKKNALADRKSTTASMAATLVITVKVRFLANG